jgi:lipoprotein-anchoring transpeptidase ErfK/SrfK
MQEIGGIRLSAAEMQQVFSAITVGTRVEVR